MFTWEQGIKPDWENKGVVPTVLYLNTFDSNKNIVKGTVSVISSDPPCNEGNTAALSD